MLSDLDIELWLAAHRAKATKKTSMDRGLCKAYESVRDWLKAVEERQGRPIAEGPNHAANGGANPPWGDEGRHAILGVLEKFPAAGIELVYWDGDNDGLPWIPEWVPSDSS